MKHVLVVGLGISGKSAAAFLLSKGVSVNGIDRNASTMENDPDIIQLMKDGLSIQPESDLKDLRPYDLIIASPGIPSNHSIFIEAAKNGIEVCGEIELGSRFVKNRMVGITGTNGKTTVTLLVTHVLNKSGKTARALGNVGVPLTKELLKVSSEEILVLELSSYQLETISQRVLDAAVILNITPDHLDRYESMSDYAAAKFKIVDCLKTKAPLFLEENLANEFNFKSSNLDIKTYGYTPTASIFSNLNSVYVNQHVHFELPDSIKGRSSHDLENLMAAYAICMVLGVNPQEFLDAFRTFKKPSHRIEFVREKAGVYYYDDSKGTNIDAVIRAVESLHGKIILIAGGVDKGSPYTPWIKGFTEKVKLICAIGQSADKIHEQISTFIPVWICKNIEEAVKLAERMAAPGDNVLLSPGCSSFDMFKDYVHRGEVFQRAVNLL